MPSVYTFKESPYSSHSLLLNAFPPEGRGRTVLDIGCGDGHLAGRLAARGYRVTGVERAGGYTPDFPAGVELLEADLDRGLPPLARRFDYVMCADILEHLRDPGALLREIRSALEPRGMLVASLPNSGNLYFRLNVLAGRFPQHDKGLFDRTHLHFYTWSGWRDLLAASGFAIRQVQTSGIPVSLAVPPRLAHSARVRGAEALCYGLSRLRKTLFAYQFIVSADVA